MTSPLRQDIKEPRPRRDGKCVVCKEVKPILVDTKGIYRIDLDPFCSTKCCRKYYGTEDERTAIVDEPLNRERKLVKK